MAGIEIRRSRSVLPIIALGLLVAGCASDSQLRVGTEIHGLVSPGTPLQSAQDALWDAGFECADTGGGRSITCTRQRSHRIVASCIQRAILYPVDGRIDRIEVPAPSCAGL